MSFLSPEYLLFMFVPILILFYLIVTGRSMVESIFDAKMLERLTFDNDTLGRTGRNIMLFIALISMIVALARPVLPRTQQTLWQKRHEVVIALDISRSMLAQDLYPDRLTLAKRHIQKLLHLLEGDEIGLLAFSNEGFMVSPMTTDTATLAYLLTHLSTESLSTQGTDISIVIEKASQMLRRSRPKILILFTDGGDRRDFSAEIARAKKSGMQIYIYALGSEKGAPIPWKGGLLKDEKGRIVLTKRNDAIARLALQSGGGYFVWDAGGRSLHALADTIRHRTASLRKRTIRSEKELFYYPIMIALVFMLFAFGSLPQRGATLLLCLAFAAMPPSARAASITDFLLIKKAHTAYEKGAYRKAAELYARIARSKRNAEAYYALANAYYKAGRYRAALKAYARVVTQNPALEYKKLFNMGNSYFRLKAYDKALELYLKAQKLHDEADLRYNIALAKKHLRRQRRRNKNQKRQQKSASPNAASHPQRSAANQKAQKAPQKGKKAALSTTPHAQKRLSEEEIRAWDKRLSALKPKTRPLKFETNSTKRERHVHPW